MFIFTLIKLIYFLKFGFAIKTPGNKFNMSRIYDNNWESQTQFPIFNNHNNIFLNSVRKRQDNTQIKNGHHMV